MTRDRCSDSRGGATFRNNLPQHEVQNHDISHWNGRSSWPRQQEGAGLVEMDDWWRVVVIVAVIAIGCALVLYVGVEWATAT